MHYLFRFQLFYSLHRLGGQGILLGYLNTFVHAVMYTYYLLSIWMPEIKQSKSTKKNITRLQMVSILEFMNFSGEFSPFCLKCVYNLLETLEPISFIY